MRAAAALLLWAALATGGCEERQVAAIAPAASSAQVEARSARAAYDKPAELAWLAAGAAARRRVAAGFKAADPAPTLAAMVAAVGPAWTVDRFAAAAGSAPPVSAEIAAAQQAFADAAEQVRTGRVADLQQISDRAKAIAETDAAATLPARFGPEVTLLVQRMIAGYTALADGRAARMPPAQLAAEIVRDGRAAAGIAREVVRAGRGGPTAELLREVDQATGGAYWARWGLAAMPVAEANRLIAWNRSPAGRAHNDMLLARWAQANDAAGIDMLTRFFSAQVPTKTASPQDKRPDSGTAGSS